jgi:hypothetical protein
MQEQQCEDFFVPTFLMNLPSDPDADAREKSSGHQYDNAADDFLKGIQGWSEFFSLDECAE